MRGLCFPPFLQAHVEPPALADLQRELVFGSSISGRPRRWSPSPFPDNIRYCQKVSTAAAGLRATAAPGTPVFGLVTLPTGSYCVCLYGDTIVADGRGGLYSNCAKIRAANLLRPTTIEDKEDLKHLKLWWWRITSLQSRAAPIWFCYWISVAYQPKHEYRIYRTWSKVLI